MKYILLVKVLNYFIIELKDLESIESLKALPIIIKERTVSIIANPGIIAK